jgi:hypothetical protein
MLPLISASRAKSVRPPAEGESLSLACPRESNQREGHPAYALAGLSLPGFGRHLVNGFCLSLRWRAVAIERVQALTIVKDLDVVKHLGLHLVMRLMATR